MRRSTHVLRRPLVLFVLVALTTAACRDGGNNEATEPPVTEPPTASPGVQSAGTFQLAGDVEHAFQGVGPPIEVSLAGVSLSPTPGTTGATGPTPTAGTTGAPTQQGVMRVTLDNVSSELRETCGATAGNKVNVFWLTDTQFDTSLITGTTLEGSLEDRRVGVAGSIFTTSGTQQQPDFALPSPTVSPATTAGTLNTNCTLVADRVTSGTEGTALPTVRPRPRTGATSATTRPPTTRPPTTRPPTTRPPTTAPPTTAPPTTAPPTSPPVPG